MFLGHFEKSLAFPYMKSCLKEWANYLPCGRNGTWLVPALICLGQIKNILKDQFIHIGSNCIIPFVLTFKCIIITKIGLKYQVIDFLSKSKVICIVLIAFVIQTFESRATELRGFHSHTNNWSFVLYSFIFLENNIYRPVCFPHSWLLSAEVCANFVHF